MVSSNCDNSLQNKKIDGNGKKTVSKQHFCTKGKSECKQGINNISSRKDQNHFAYFNLYESA